MSNLLPLRFIVGARATTDGYEWKKTYGNYQYYTNNNDFIIWRDKYIAAQQWRCSRTVQIMPNSQALAITAAYDNSGLEQARFRRRKDVVSALENLYATIEQ